MRLIGTSRLHLRRPDETLQIIGDARPLYFCVRRRVRTERTHSIRLGDRGQLPRFRYSLFGDEVTFGQSYGLCDVLTRICRRDALLIRKHELDDRLAT